VIEDCGDGWWRAYGVNNTVGRVPANYFEVLPNNEEQPAGEEGYSYEYSAEGYDYNSAPAEGGSEHVETQQPASTPEQSAQPEKPAPAQPANPPIATSPAYVEQMKCWGDILETQKQEKQKLERQIADSELSLNNLRKEAFFFKQLDFILQEVLKLETEMDLDLDASVQFQRTQLALSRVLHPISFFSPFFFYSFFFYPFFSIPFLFGRHANFLLCLSKQQRSLTCFACRIFVIKLPPIS
jgi:hypothetical protein